MPEPLPMLPRDTRGRPLHDLRIFDELLTDDLFHGDTTTGAGMSCFVDDTHASMTKLSLDLVFAPDDARGRSGS